MAQNKKNRLLWFLCLAALAVFGAAMVWLHYQQLCSPGGGDDPYTSDLGQHLYFAQQGMIYSTVSLLIGPAYDIAGRIGIAVLLAVFHLAAVAARCQTTEPAMQTASKAYSTVRRFGHQALPRAQRSSAASTASAIRPTP